MIRRRRRQASKSDAIGAQLDPPHIKLRRLPARLIESKLQRYDLFGDGLRRWLDALLESLRPVDSGLHRSMFVHLELESPRTYRAGESPHASFCAAARTA